MYALRMPRRELSRFRQLLVNWTNKQLKALHSKSSSSDDSIAFIRIKNTVLLLLFKNFALFRLLPLLVSFGSYRSSDDVFGGTHKQFRTKHTYKSWERLGGRVGTSGTFQDLSGLPAAAGDKSFYFCHFFKYENSAYYLLLCNLLVILKSLNTQIYDAMRNFIEWIKLNKLNWSAQNVNFFHSSDVVLQSIK